MTAADDAPVLTIIEHLDELRSRLIAIAIAMAIGSIVGFLASDAIVAWLLAAVPDGDASLVQLNVMEALSVRLTIALMVGVALAMPVMLYNAWRFVTPGLAARERRLVWPLLIVAIALFIAGVLLGYALIPYGIAFLLGLGLDGVDPMLRLSDYIGFTTTTMLLFGVILEFPVVMVGLARVGIVNYRFLASRRRWAILLFVVFAVVATPGGDPVTPTILAAVMYVLFELALQVVRVIHR